ncbi:MAG: hypothetical protein U0Q55_06360 [Vicinamibacterales bacterium]
MSVQFLVNDLWSQLRRLAKSPKRRAWVAVPYLGPGAADRLPLRHGDVLVTCCNEHSARAGVVDPREVVTFIKRGVEVHSVANLHAKVYVFGRRAVVGSANVSGTSEHHLIEAGCMLSSPKLVAECRDFVKRLRGEIVELEFASGLVSEWRPPKMLGVATSSKGKASRVARHSGLVAVALQELEFDEVDQGAAVKARESAEQRLTDRSRFRLDEFVWRGRLPAGIRRGARVLACTARSRGQIFIAPPARVLEVRRYKSGRGTERQIVVFEARKYVREKTRSAVLKALGKRSAPLRNLRNAKLLTDAALAHELGQLWPSV